MLGGVKMKRQRHIRLFFSIFLLSGILIGLPGIFHPLLGIQEAHGIAVDAVSTNACNCQQNSYSHTVSGSDRLLVVSVHTDNGTSVSSVTYDGQSLTQVSTVVHSSGKPRAEVWRLIAPPVGSYDIVVDLASSDKVLFLGDPCRKTSKSGLATYLFPTR